jgi:hypothetical protein
LQFSHPQLPSPLYKAKGLNWDSSDSESKEDRDEDDFDAMKKKQVITSKVVLHPSEMITGNEEKTILLGFSPYFDDEFECTDEPLERINLNMEVLFKNPG